jgi:hypothetical protein
MSLLSDTRGTPRNIWAMVKLLAVHKGELDRDVLVGWMDPFNKTLDVHGNTISGNPLNSTIGAASSLDLIENNRSNNKIKLLLTSSPKTISDFADFVHQRLAGIPFEHPDSVILEAFSWFLASSAKQKKTTWIKDFNRTSLSEAINTALMTENSKEPEDNRFNSTKMPYWREWISFLGLGIETPSTQQQVFYPYITERLNREINELSSKFGFDVEIEASDFLRELRKRMPYIDEGTHFKLAAKRIGFNPAPRELSIVFSTALRELQDDGVIDLKMYGDARDAFILSGDPTHKQKSFRTVTIKSLEAENE